MNDTGLPFQQWWNPALKGEDLRAAAYGFGDALWNSEAEQARRNNFLTYASQYLGRPVNTLEDFTTRAGLSDALPAGRAPTPTGRSTRNLTRTLVDTAMSRFAKSETRVQWLTNGGTEVQQEKAEEATDAANSLLEQTGSETELRRAALHACVFDLGIVKEIDGPDGPEVEHVPSWELMYDPADAHRGKPTIRVQRFPADREAMIVKFLAPKEGETQEETDAREEAISKLRAGAGNALVTGDHTQTETHVIVYELRRDPIGRRAGRLVICTDDVLLADEKIEPGSQKKSAPYILFGYTAALIGAYPTSIAAIVSELQAELDGMKTRRAQIIRLCAVPRYLATGPDGSEFEVQVRGGSDAIGDIVRAPPGSTLTAIDTGAGQSLEALTAEENASWARGFEMTGINPSNAIGSRPVGLNSAPSQREWNEIAQDRLSLVALDYQMAHVDLAELLLVAVADMPDYEISIKSPNGRFLKKVKVADLNLANSDYVLIPFPIGALPTTPTGKLAAAGDLLQMGAIDKDQFQEIVQLPDLKGQLNINLSAQRAVQKLISKMLATGEPIAPPECIDGPAAVAAFRYVTAKWLDGVAGEPVELDQHRLDMLQAWMDELGNRIQAAKAPAGPAPGAGALAPGGALAPAPVLGGKVGASPVALAPTGIAPLQNHEFAPAPAPGGFQ